MKKIFLIEDDSAIVDIYTMIFKKANFSIEAMGSGKEAIDKIKNITEGKTDSKPDLVLLDLILPDMNGIEVIKAIRANDMTKDIKVFIMTNQEKNQLQELDEAKPDKIIIKAHTSPTQLLDIVKEELK